MSFESQWGRSSPGPLSTLDWEKFRRAMPGFSSFAVIGTSPVALRMKQGALTVRADFVSGGYFRTLGTKPVTGRLLTEFDDLPSAAPSR
jgi:hypothetical protein